MLWNSNVFENNYLNYYHKKPETNPETWYVNEIFLIIVNCYITSEMFWKGLFNGIVFENGDWNYCHQKSQRWYMSMEILLNISDILYTVEKALKSAIKW